VFFYVIDIVLKGYTSMVLTVTTPSKAWTGFARSNTRIVGSNPTRDINICVGYCGPPLWSSGQSSWLRIRRPGFDSRHYQKKKVMGLERGPLSLVSTTEELRDRKVAAPV
jgi:hypothetical protein